MKLTPKAITLALLASALSAGTLAAGFAKTQTYEAGKFADVPETEWYASSVATAYELGFMKGSSDTAFEPEGNMTLAEALTIASRVHDIYNGGKTTFGSGEANWYDDYVAYAIKNGIIAEGEYTDYERNATRAEMAVIFSKTVPASFLGAINTVNEIPDVPSTNKAFEPLKLLYNAGVVLGNDEFGTFLANNNITRAEAAAIIGRVALPENRLHKTLTDANFGDAFYVLTDFSPMFSSGRTLYDSAWNYDNRARVGAVSNGANFVSDYYMDSKVVLWRDLDDLSDGLFGMDFNGSMTVVSDADESVYIALTDDDGNAVLNLCPKNGKWTINGKATDVDFRNGALYISVRGDLDKNTADVTINGTTVKDAALGDYTISRVYNGTGDKSTGAVTFSRFDIFANYLVNEAFITATNGDGIPAFDLKGTGSVETTGGQSNADTKSAKLTGASAVEKTFPAVSGNVVFEAQMLFPKEGDEGFISLGSGETSVAWLDITDEGVFSADGEKLRFHNHNIWQTLRIEANTVTNTVTYKVNGKVVGTKQFDNMASTVDNIALGSTKGECFFDDVKVYMTHEYDDYCPTPVPQTDDGYDVIINICSLWREGAHWGWGAISGYEENEPALGYYDEGITEVTDWEIKFWVENGIDVAHFCWYAPSADIKQPIHNSSHNYDLHDGYFNAKYSDMMKFAFMWENTGINVYNLDQFKEYLWNYWMDYYFLDPRYYTVDNKLVFTVWSPANFKTSFGGAEGAKAAVDFMNEDAKAHGFDGVMLFFATQSNAYRPNIDNFISYGGTGTYAYHWGQDGNSYNGNVKNISSYADIDDYYLIPTVSVGFNNIGWSGKRKDLISVEDHKKVLEYIKNEYLPKKQGWQSKMVWISTWNEYGEGTYVMPCEKLHGFDYIANISTVLSGSTDHSTNIYPTAQQKARLCHLYAQDKTALMHLDSMSTVSGASDVDASVPAKLLGEYTGDCFRAGNCGESASYYMNSIVATPANHDPILSLNSDITFKPIDVDADALECVRVVTRSEKDTYFQIFFLTADSPSPNEAMSYKFVNKASASLKEYIINIEDLSFLKGQTITGIRVDPSSTAGAEFAVDAVEFRAYDETQLPIVITVDRVAYNPIHGPELDENGEMYVVADAYNGFFSLHNFYYEWNRRTGVLRILTKSDREFIFTVGSDQCLVDGKEMPLLKKVGLYDGLPVLPLYFIYNTEGIKYNYDGAKNVTVQFMSDEELAKSNDRVAYQYEFEVPGDIEGFAPSGCTLAVVGGCLSGDATAREGVSPRYDPMFTLSGISLDTLECNKIVVGMKHQLDDGKEKANIEIFFATTSSPGLAQAKSARKLIETNSSNEVIEYTLDFSENEAWDGTVTTIRVDPIDCGGHFDIDYIRFVIDEETVQKNKEKAEALKKAQEERAAKGLVIDNGNAEDESMPKVFFGASNNANIELAVDPTDENNHVWKVSPVADSGQIWCYIRQNVVYIPGMTYHASVRVYPVKTGSGETEFDAQLFPNIVYADGDKADHLVKEFDVPAGKWTTIEFDFTVSSGSSSRNSDQFTLYTNPYKSSCGIYYLVDDIVVSKKN